MTARRPEPRPIDGRTIRLEPLDRAHYPELFTAIAHPEVFAGGYGGGPAGLPTTQAEFDTFADGYFTTGVRNTYVIRLVGGEHDGLLVGTSTLGDFDEPGEAAHLGWTAYDPRVWGTAVNAETKLLLLGLAFDAGFGRVKIQADERNERSRTAILRLGATFEGLIRRDKQRADGTWRTTALFSVLAEEWPEVRSGLEERLARNPGPVALRG